FIDVESPRGKGTSFHLYFPVTMSESTLFRTADGQQTAAPGGNETILLVEDEEALRDGVKSLLEERGYRVLTARDGLEAVETHATHREEIALSVIDLLMPRMGGWEAFLKIKETAPRAKAIVVSGNVDSSFKNEMLARSVQAVLRKPFSPDEFLRKVREVLDRAGPG